MILIVNTNGAVVHTCRAEEVPAMKARMVNLMECYPDLDPTECMTLVSTEQTEGPLALGCLDHLLPLI